MVNPSWGSFQKPSDVNKNIVQNNEQITSDEKKPEAEKPQWGNFDTPMTYQGESDPKEEESNFGYLARNLAASTSRILEQGLGRYGNLEKFSKDTLTNLSSSGGIAGWAISKLMGPEKWELLVRGPEGRQQLLPTSEQFKQFSELLTGGYTKPKTEGEKRFQDKIEDIGSTISVRSFTNPNLRNIALNSFVTPVVAGVTKDIVEDVGFGEDKANLAKAAVWLPMSLAFNVNASRYASNLMNKGRNGFNADLQVDVPRYEQGLNRAARNMLQGDPGSSLAQQQLAGIRNDIANGQTSMRDLFTRYDAINRAKRDRGLFALNPTDRRAAIRSINEVRDVVRNEIQQLGQTNPQALSDWQNGVQAWATIHKSNSIRNFVEDVAKGPYSKILTGPAAALFGMGSLGAVKAPIVSAPLTAGTAGAYKTGQTLYRMYNSPTLSRYYFDAISAAQSENIPAFINNYQKLNNKIEKSGSSNPDNK